MPTPLSLPWGSDHDEGVPTVLAAIDYPRAATTTSVEVLSNTLGQTTVPTTRRYPISLATDSEVLVATLEGATQNTKMTSRTVNNAM